MSIYPIKSGLPIPEPGKQILKEARSLAHLIRKTWDSLPLEDLAGKIINLKDRVAPLNPNNPSVQRIQKIADRLHFLFVFPIAKELQDGLFAQSVLNTASRTRKKIDLFYKEFNQTQQREILRYARGGG